MDTGAPLWDRSPEPARPTAAQYFEGPNVSLTQSAGCLGRPVFPSSDKMVVGQGCHSFRRMPPSSPPVSNPDLQQLPIPVKPHSQ